MNMRTTRVSIRLGSVIAMAILLGCNKTAPTLTPALTDAATIARNVERPPVQPAPAQLAPSQDDDPIAAELAVVEPNSPRRLTEPKPLVTNYERVTSGPLLEPKVLMSDAHGKTCRLIVGQTIADVTVTDMHGTDHQLAALLGDHLTVMVFWDENSATSLEQFRRIPIDILADFAPDVKVIAVNVGSDIAQVQNLTGDAADRIVSLVDSDGVLFGQFATSLIPRTYIVDRQGTILWFDIEYSQSTQRTMRESLAYFLKNS